MRLAIAGEVGSRLPPPPAFWRSLPRYLLHGSPGGTPLVAARDRFSAFSPRDQLTQTEANGTKAAPPQAAKPRRDSVRDGPGGRTVFACNSGLPAFTLPRKTTHRTCCRNREIRGPSILTPTTCDGC